MPTCYEKKIVTGKPCYAAKVRHKKCGHIGCDSKGDCPSSLMTKMGRCRGCDGSIYIGDTERVQLSIFNNKKKYFEKYLANHQR